MCPVSIYYRRARLAFHQVCGTLPTNNGTPTPTPCDLQVQSLHSGGNVTKVFHIDESHTLNDGSADNITEWFWEDIQLPITSAGTRLMFLGDYDRFNGVVSLDNIRFYTRQK